MLIITGVITDLKSPAFHNTHCTANGMVQWALPRLASGCYPVNSDDEGNCSAILEDGTAHGIICPPRLDLVL